MTATHRELAAGRWFELPLVEQMANIGSEIERAISWRGRSEKNSTTAFDRGLELLDLTIADPRHRQRLRELTRVREALADHFVFDNHYASTDESWRRYFHAFTYAAAAELSRCVAAGRRPAGLRTRRRPFLLAPLEVLHP